MTGRLRRINAILLKDVAELRRNQAALVPIFILAAVSVGLPFFIALIVPSMAGEPLSTDRSFARVVQESGGLRWAGLHPEAAVQAFLFQQFMTMQLLIPVTGSMAFAGHSLIGEKQARTLEPLLATPISTAELLIAKALGALLPSLAIAVGAALVYFGCIWMFALPGVLHAVFDVRVVLQMAALGPIAALTAVQIAVLVSSRVNDPRTAQQFGVLLILPLTVAFVAQFNGSLRLTVGLILAAMGVLTAVWLVLVLVGVVLFEREAILTRWK